MKQIFKISLILFVIGALATAPISKHLCRDMMTHTTMSQNMENHCCEHESNPIDCCHDEINDLNINYITSYSFENVTIEKISDFWISFIYSGFNKDLDTYQLTKRYLDLQNSKCP